MDDKLKEAMEWAKKPHLNMDCYQEAMVSRLLDAARSAESSEAKAIERCADIVRHMRIVVEKEPYTVLFQEVENKIRSLAPARECMWWMDEDRRAHHSCKHMLPAPLIQAVWNIVNWGNEEGILCPGCGAPIRVED